MPLTTVKDLTGFTFGQLTVLSRAPSEEGSKRAHWLCICTCGTRIVKNGKYLLCGDTTTCGCAQRALRKRGNPKYSAIAYKLHKREYTIWRSMKSRCYTRSSSNYQFYGLLGVTVCAQWLDNFEAFLADMGDCPRNYTLDRIDPRGNYEPANCRWASWATQRMNKRRHHAATLRS